MAANCGSEAARHSSTSIVLPYRRSSSRLAFSLRTMFKCPTRAARASINKYYRTIGCCALDATTGRSRGCIRQVCIITMRGFRNVRVGWLALVISGASGRSTSARRRHNTIPLGSSGGIRASVTTWDQSTGRATLFPRAAAPIAASPLPSPPLLLSLSGVADATWIE